MDAPYIPCNSTITDHYQWHNKKGAAFQWCTIECDVESKHWCDVIIDPNSTCPTSGNAQWRKQSSAILNFTTDHPTTINDPQELESHSQNSDYNFQGWDYNLFSILLSTRSLDLSHTLGVKLLNSPWLPEVWDKSNLTPHCKCAWPIQFPKLIPSFYLHNCLLNWIQLNWIELNWISMHNYFHLI